MPRTAPYGSWQSPVTTDLLTGGSVGLAALAAEGGRLYWLETRPDEAGRSTLMRWSDGKLTELTAKPHDVGSRVHEYGGGAYVVANGWIVFSDRRDGTVWLMEPLCETRLLAKVEGCRFADFAFDLGRNRILAVREDHRDRPASDPANAIVALDLATPPGLNEGKVLVAGADFVAAPRPSPDGSRLLWLEWDHPDMPWDATRLLQSRIDAAGIPEAPMRVGGPERQSILQPEWTADGAILFLSDVSGWWNLYRADETVTAVAPVEADLGSPAWQFGARHYTQAGDAIVATLIEAGRRHAVILGDGRWSKLAFGPVMHAPVVHLHGYAAIVTPPDRPPAVAALGGPEDAEVSSVRSAMVPVLKPADISVGQPIRFPTAGGGEAHAFLYRPHNASFQAPAGERPPLVVLGHGGPTSMTGTGLSLSIQWWTTRGFAVADVNYRGSSGYGRAYRQLLEGAWGVADVEDCVAVVDHLVGMGEVDPARVAIRGGSAGGFTVLSALVASDRFKAGASLYGVADLMRLAEETHKFEARYLDRLIGPLPEAEALYRDRSPLGHADRILAPVIFFQGEDDKVVPPNQTLEMVEALRRNGRPVAYYPFAGEGHGFRRAETIRAVLELELDFYAQIFGFTARGLGRRAAIENWPQEDKR